MLEHYEDTYKSLLGDKDGPRIMVDEEGEKHQKLIAEIEKSPINYVEYTDRIEIDVKHTLKECGGTGVTYSSKQKELMIWYTYFFLNRGKPSTHIEAFSKIDNTTLAASMPPLFNRLISAAEKLLRGETL